MLHRILMTVLCVVVLGLCGAMYVSAQPKQPTYRLEFSQGSRTRQTAEPAVVDGLFDCYGKQELAACLQRAGRDICAKDEVFEVLASSGFDRDRDGNLEFRYRCTLTTKKPVI